MLFGIIFVRNSYVVPSESFTQVDATHWTLDVSALGGGAYADVRDVCLFVPAAGLLPPGAGLADVGTRVARSRSSLSSSLRGAQGPCQDSPNSAVASIFRMLIKDCRRFSSNGPKTLPC